MSTYNNASVPLRTRLERAFAGLIFGGATALVVSGTFAVCLQSAWLAV